MKSYVYVASLDIGKAKDTFSEVPLNVHYHYVGMFVGEEFTPERKLTDLNRYQLLELKFSALVEFDCEEDAEVYLDFLVETMKNENKLSNWFSLPNSTVEYRETEIDGDDTLIVDHVKLDTPVIEAIQNMEIDYLRFVFENQFYEY